MEKIKTFISDNKVVFSFISGIVVVLFLLFMINPYRTGYDLGYLKALNDMKVKIDLGNRIIVLPDSEYDKLYNSN